MKIEHLITELRKAKVGATTTGATPAQPATTQAGKTLSMTPNAIRKRNAKAAAATSTPAQPATAPTPPQSNVGSSSNVSNEPGIGSRIATGVGRFVQGTGNLASQVAGAVTQPIGAAFGGLKKGFRTANRGDTFKLPNQRGYEPSQDVPSGSDDLADLKSMIQRIDQRLTNAGIKETKKR